MSISHVNSALYAGTQKYQNIHISQKSNKGERTCDFQHPKLQLQSNCGWNIQIYAIKLREKPCEKLQTDGNHPAALFYQASRDFMAPPLQSNQTRARAQHHGKRRAHTASSNF